MKRPVTIVGIVLIAVLLLVLLCGGALALGSFGMRGTTYNGSGVRGFGGPFAFGLRPVAMLFLCVFWAVVIGIVVAIVSWLLAKCKPAAVAVPEPGVETPLDVLKARYARGEITKEQFDAIKKDLE